MLRAEDVAGPEWADWYRLTPLVRFRASEKLWQVYLALGGSLDPEPDTQSPFFDPGEPRARCSWEARRCGQRRRPFASVIGLDRDGLPSNVPRALVRGGVT